MPKPKPVPEIDPLGAIVDELGALDAELKPMAPKIARRDALRKTLREAFTEKSAELEYSVSGARFEAKLGPKGWENTVNTVKLAKAIGAKAFLVIARVTLGSLATLTGGAPAGCVDSARSGPRSIAMYEKG